MTSGLLQKCSTNSATMDSQTLQQRLLTAPVLPLILRQALPVIAVLLLQTLVGVAETFYVSFLGTDALAGVALVFPVVMLMTMMSAGGIGGGVSSAIARSLGAGKTKDANALVLHALVLAIFFGLIFTGGVIAGGPALYRALGGSGRSLDAALTYSLFVFMGSVPIWVLNQLAAALRGAGNVRTPAVVSFVGAAVLIPLSPALIFGFGPLPGLGIAGAGIAVTLFDSLAAVALLWILIKGRAGLTLRWAPLETRLFRQILGVGLLSAIGTFQLNATVVMVTGIVGLFGADALAGFGTASRLDYVLIPPLFGLGTAVVTLVGTAIGAGNQTRARQVAWTGALLAFLVTETIGIVVAVVPSLWLRIFSHDPAVLATGALYLQRIGPAYGATGLGMLLYFAGQGNGRVALPFLGGTIRLLFVIGAGWLAVVHFGSGLPTLFTIVAAGAVLNTAVTAISVSVQLGVRLPALYPPLVRKLKARTPV
jgi:MATE family, multidrug efflux pump